jgi:hypothetical protein
MKIAVALTAALFLFQQADGCDDAKPTPAPTPPPPINRFVPVANHGSSDVALDTATGQLCRTWEWQYRGANNPMAGGIDTLPTCLSLYQAPMPIQLK